MIKNEGGESINRVDTFRVLSLLRLHPLGVTFSQIQQNLKCSAPAVKNHLKRLRRSGQARRLGYGLWTAPPGESIKSDRGITRGDRRFLGHNFCFRVPLPKGFRWGVVPALVGVAPLPGAVRRLGLTFEGCRVWLCTRSILVFCPHEFSGDTAEGARDDAVTWFRVGLWPRLASFLRLFGLRAVVELTERSHYARMRDSAARYYNDRREKVRVRLRTSFCVVDHSDRADHLEVQGEDPGVLDHAIGPWLRSVERNPGVTWEALTLELARIQAVATAAQIGLVLDRKRRVLDEVQGKPF